MHDTEYGGGGGGHFFDLFSLCVSVFPDMSGTRLPQQGSFTFWLLPCYHFITLPPSTQLG